MTQLTDRVTRQMLEWKYRADGLLEREEGQDAMEYAVVAAVVVVVVAGVSSLFTTQIQTSISVAFTKINSTISSIT